MEELIPMVILFAFWGIPFFTFYVRAQAVKLHGEHKDLFDLVGIDNVLFFVVPLIAPTKALKEKLMEMPEPNKDMLKLLKIIKIYRLYLLITLTLFMGYGLLNEIYRWTPSL